MTIAQVVPVLVTLALAWSGFLAGIIRWLQNKNEEAIAKRLGNMENSIGEIKAELSGMPRCYVLKEDCRRQEDQILSALAIINKKLDELQRELIHHA